jgi:hypothetical protein
MIEQYIEGRHMIIAGKKYYRDLKIIDGHIKEDWWRNQGHRLNTIDIHDILSTKPEVLVIGTGYAGNMRVPRVVRSDIENQNINVIEEITSKAVETFNHLYAEGKDVAGAFHLTC